MVKKYIGEESDAKVTETDTNQNTIRIIDSAIIPEFDNTFKESLPSRVDNDL